MNIVLTFLLYIIHLNYQNSYIVFPNTYRKVRALTTRLLLATNKSHNSAKRALRCVPIK